MRVKLENLVLFSGMVVLWHLILSSCGMYGSRRLSTRQAEIVDVLKATTMCAASLLVVAPLFAIKMITPRFTVIFWILSFGLMTCGRLLMRYGLYGARRRGTTCATY